MQNGPSKHVFWAVMLFTASVLSGCSGGNSSSTPAPAPQPVGTIALGASSVTVAQSAGSVTLSVGRAGGSSGVIAVSYVTADGTAVAGKDYTAASGALNWSDGDASTKTISIPLSTSPAYAGSKTFTFNLSSATGGAGLGTSIETVTINGSGAPGTIALSASATTVAQSAGSVTISATRSGGSAGAVTAAYTTQAGTAIQGTDYTLTTGTFSWADGDASTKSVNVPISTALGFDGTRTFSFVLSQVTGGATLGTATETVNITGSGAPGTVALAGQTLTVAQSAATATLTFTRTGGSTSAVGLNYTTADGTAVAGTDYTKTTGTVSWAAGDSSNKTVNVPLRTTPFFAGTRSFTVSITSTTGGAQTGNTSTAVNITGTLLPPSNYFTFSFATGSWKLQLPIDQYGGTGGTNNIQYPSIEESTAQLQAGFVDPYFYADTGTYGGATNHILFTAPSNGAVTTPGSGSDHTRSELRELYTGVGANSNSDWNSSIGGTLTGSCIINSVAASSDEATFAQIHNQSYVFMLLMYRPAKKDIVVDIYSSLGSSSHTRTPQVTNVNLGDPITYSIAYKDNSMVVTVNGTTQTYAIDSSWAGTPMYFKLGAYHAAPNIGNPAGDQTQVVYGSFSVSH